MTETPKAPESAVRCGACGVPPREPEVTEASEPLTHCEWCGAEYPVPPEK